MTSRVACLFLSFALTAFAVMPLAPARAGGEHPPELPQVLGLAMTREPAPLDCRDGTCSGFFTAFCLQETRPRPEAGHRYDAAGDGDITVAVTRADGSVAEFSATGLLRFESTGAYTSVRISMDMDRLAALDARAVALTVPARVSLVPRAEPDQMARPSAEDLEAATGMPRLLAEGFFERGSGKADAGAIMTRLINLLPPEGHAAPALRGTVWEDALGTSPDGTYTPDGLARARDAYERCKAYGDQGYRVRLRSCLETSHDRLMRHLNDKYWDADAGF